MTQRTGFVLHVKPDRVDEYVARPRARVGRRCAQR